MEKTVVGFWGRRVGGATTLQGIEGYGHSGKVHTVPKWLLVDPTPDHRAHHRQPGPHPGFLPQLDDLAGRCLIVCDEIDVVATAGQRTDRTDPTDLSAR